MQRWLLLLAAHDHVREDRHWPVAVRIDTCRLLLRKMLELGELKPIEKETYPAGSTSTNGEGKKAVGPAEKAPALQARAAGHAAAMDTHKS